MSPDSMNFNKFYLTFFASLTFCLQPKSLKELEELTGRAKSNLSRTLKTLERYGIAELEKQTAL